MKKVWTLPLVMLVSLATIGQALDPRQEAAAVFDPHNLNRNDLVLAERLKMENFLFADQGDQMAWIGWFLTFCGQGPDRELFEAAERVILESEGGLATWFALYWLRDYRIYQGGWMASLATLLEQQSPHWPLDLRIAAADFMMASSEITGDRSIRQRAMALAGARVDWQFLEKRGQYPLAELSRLEVCPPLEAEASGLSSGDRLTVLPPQSFQGAGLLLAREEFQVQRSGWYVFSWMSFQNAKLWLDQELILDHFPLQTHDSPYRRGEIYLKKGSHVFTLALTQTHQLNGQFQLFLPLETPKRQGPGKNGDVREGSLFDALGAKVSGSDPLALMVQVMGHISDRRTETALRLLGNYLREHPEACLMALPFVRLADRDYPFFPTEEKWEIFGRLLRNTERQPCDCLEFNLWVIQQMRSAKMGADAGQFLAHLLEGSPQNPVLLEEAYSFAKEENIQELKRAVTRALEELGPDHHWGQLMLWRLAKDSGNTAMEQRCLEQLQHLFPLSRYRADYFDFIGAHPQAVEALEEQLTLTPEDAAIAEAIAGQYQKMGRIEDQMTWLQKALALDPTRSEAVVDLMNLHLYWGNPEKAEALLNSYLSHEPESASVRVLLSHLLGETEFEAYRLSTEDLLQLAATQGESSADSELILDQMVIRLFPDGSQLRYTHLVTRVRTKKGIDEESEILLPRRHELLELRTIKPDGRIIFPEILPHKNSVSLTDLTVGDLIDEEHIEVVPPSSFDRDGANNDMTFVFQSDSRFYHHSEIVIIYPEDLKVAPEFLERHYPQKVETSRKGGLIHKRWLMKNNAPLETEPHMPSPGGFFPRMTFNYNTTWEDLRDFHVDGMARRRKMGQALHAWLAPFQGRSADRETAQAVYDAVMAEVEPVGTFLNPIDQLWHQKKGNPALLLWSLYEQLGFEVRLLLSQPRQARNQVFFVPHLSLFQHPLVQLTFEDEIVILETGLPHFPFGQFPYDFAGGEALVIDPFASPLVTLPETFGPQKEVASLYQMTLDAQGTLRGSGEERFNGALASRLHQYHQGVTDKERLQQVENSVNHNFPGARLLEVSVNEVPKGSFALTFLMETESWLPPLTDGMEIPFLLPKNKLYETYTSAPQRRFPLRLGEPVTNDARIELTLPAGMTWHLTPSVQEEDSPFGTYRLALSLSSPQTLVMHRVYSLHQEEIAPEDYSAFQAFCRSLRALENRVFTLRKTDGNP